MLVGSTKFNSYNDFLRASTSGRVRVVSMGIGTVRLLVGLVLHHVRGRRNNCVLGITSSTKLLPTKPCVTTCCTAGTCVTDLAHTITLRLGRENDHICIKTLYPKPIGARFGTITGMRFTLTKVAPRCYIECTLGRVGEHGMIVIPALALGTIAAYKEFVPRGILVTVATRRRGGGLETRSVSWSKEGWGQFPYRGNEGESIFDIHGKNEGLQDGYISTLCKYAARCPRGEGRESRC